MRPNIGPADYWSLTLGRSAAARIASTTARSAAVRTVFLDARSIFGCSLHHQGRLGLVAADSVIQCSNHPGQSTEA